MEFVHLHTHSHYSLLDGLPNIDQLVGRAKALGQPALALTDHGSLAGAVEFFQRAKASGLKPIIGVETYVAPGSRFDRRPKIDERPYHLTLLARTTEGYHHLIKLVTLSHLEGFYYRPRMDEEILSRYGRGLTALSGCLNGQVARRILSGELEAAAAVIRRYQKLFDGHFYLELQPRQLPEQQTVNAALRELAERTGAPLVVTNDSHYVLPEDAEAQDVLLCIQTKRVVSDQNRLSMLGEDFSLLTGDQLAKRLPNDTGAIARTVEVAASCTAEIELGRIRLPHFPVPKDQSPEAYLRQLCEAGIPRRYGRRPRAEVRKRFAYELAVIAKTGFASFFLLVQDFVNWAKEQGIVVGPGRGSSAGSIVAYLTRITNVDPLKYGLFFERFLNPDRVTLPDFDIDFADTRRDEVIRYVEGKYGKDHVAQIITFGTLAARAAVRDVGRALGFPYSYCDRVAKLVPFGATLAQSLATVPELKEISEADPDGRRLLDTARKLEGVARHASVHACGVVITKEPLTETVPLQRANQDEATIVTQYSLHPIEDLGLTKVDLLGLANLTILENAIQLVRERHGVTIDLDRLPLDDRQTFELLQAGHTTGLFQLESAGMKRYLKELKPTQLEDIIAMVSLYRPGPMELIPDFIAGKHGRKAPSYLDRRLKPILEKTYGVAVYQEQLMQIARDLAGFTLAEADVLRKAVGKKIKKLLNQQREKFVQGCVKNGVAKGTAEKIFAFIEPFARYGFNRSHAACYALIAYQTAYFKTHYPAEFMAALLTADHGVSDRVAIEIDECRALGIPVWPPDVNQSTASFTVVAADDRQGLRFGLAAIKNLGQGLAQALIDERAHGGPFENLEDFLRRLSSQHLNRKSLESLVKSGALNQFGERKQLFENLEELLVYVRSVEREAKNGQTNLFGMLPVQHLPRLKLRPVEPASRAERLAWEKELLGLYLSEHPLDDVKDQLAAVAVPCRDLGVTARNGPVTVGGLVTQIKRILTKTNEPMLFVRLEDTTGNVEVVVFPSVLKETAGVWQEDRIVLVAGRLSDKEGVPKVLCSNARIFERSTDQDEHRPGVLVIALVGERTEPATVNRVKEVLVRHPGPLPVIVTVNRNGMTSRLSTSFRVTLTPALKADLTALLGGEALDVV